MNYKMVFIGSTGGGVLSKLLHHPEIRAITHEVISDRKCGFIDIAASASVRFACIDTTSGSEFSRLLSSRYCNETQLIFMSFYTKLFESDFLHSQKGKVFNCHPSILPSCKGMHGFEDTLKSTSLFMGCSVHQVDEGMDSGMCQIQAALPLDRNLTNAQNRHKIFLAQYYSALQFCCWIIDQRMNISSEGVAFVSNNKWDMGCFAPNLDGDLFRRMGIVNEL